MDFDAIDILRPFISHGVDFETSNGDEAIGTCPFTDKARKFYVNTKTGLWDSKSAGVAGNTIQFLQRKAVHNAETMDSGRLAVLARDRKIPVDAFKDLGIGWDGTQYTLPVYNVAGKLVDVRRYRIGKRIVTTKGCHPGLYLAEQLSIKDPDAITWLCEGEWDCIALRWLTKRLGENITCVGVPGASIFNQKWIEWFQNRNVVLAYDHDVAGDKGDDLARRRLTGVARALSSIHWLDTLPVGFDIRDWVSKGFSRGVPKESWRQLRLLVGPKPRGLVEVTTPSGETPTPEGIDFTPATWDDVIATFRKWLHLPNMEGVEIAMSAFMSHRIPGDPVWIFLVAPPGGTKTETIVAFSTIEDSHMTSSLTPNSLISGASLPGGKDPSLVPKLDGKVLLVKDFTTILGMHDYEKDEIFGILRDAYDGKCGKEFGNGISRSYTSRFTIIAGVTPSIYEATERNRGLGERFLKYALGHNLDHASEDDIILRAMRNVSREEKMRLELADIVRRYYLSRSKEDPPEISDGMYLRMVALSKFGARLRGTVTRDRFRNDIMTSRPSAEIGSRLGKQVTKLARALALVRGRKEVSDWELKTMKKIILDTVPQREEDVVRWLWKECPTIDDYRSTKQITIGTRYPHATIGRLLGDLHALEVVQRGGSHNSHEWTLTPYIRNCITVSGLYTVGDERKTLRVLFRKKRRVKK